MDWNKEYQTGGYRVWHTGKVSAELVAIVTVFQPERVLDVGAGIGTEVKYLQEMGIDTVGLDISLEACRTNLLVCGTALKLPFFEERFDLVTDRGLFHHLVKTEAYEYVSEVFRVLTKHGRLLLRVARSMIDEKILWDVFSSRFNIKVSSFTSQFGAGEVEMYMLIGEKREIRNCGT